MSDVKRLDSELWEVVNVSADSEDWKQEQAEGLAAMTAVAQGLVGRTIADARVESHRDDCDAENVLVLTMTDGSTWRVTGRYGGYTGHSCDEYFEYVEVVKSSE